jgi:two-component system, NarL family, invasion response regulator UvrY
MARSNATQQPGRRGDSRPAPMRILIVDDHPIVASGCRALLAGDAGIEILEASDAESGERVFVTEAPDICVLDINLPTVSGFELARRILARAPSARIIMFSMNDDPVFAARAIEFGAKGYVSKSGDPYDLVEAIREVGNGGVYLPPAIAQSIAFGGAALAQSPLSKLTSREIEILRLLSAGKSLSEIAWLVHSSYKTIANTSSIIRQKLGLRTSSELVRFAIESRLV